MKIPMIIRSLTPDRDHAISIFPPWTPPIQARLRRGDGTADLTAALPRVQSALAGISLLHSLGGLGEDQLDVARVGHVRVDLGKLADAVCGPVPVHTRP